MNKNIFNVFFTNKLKNFKLVDNHKKKILHLTIQFYKETIKHMNII